MYINKNDDIVNDTANKIDINLLTGSIVCMANIKLNTGSGAETPFKYNTPKPNMTDVNTLVTFANIVFLRKFVKVQIIIINKSRMIIKLNMATCQTQSDKT